MSYAAGASASLNKTISELHSVLQGTAGATGKLRRKLRAKLRTLVARKAEQWYRIGFVRGHKESRRVWQETKRVPAKLTAKPLATFLRGRAKKRTRLVSKLRKTL